MIADVVDQSSYRHTSRALRHVRLALVLPSRARDVQVYPWNVVGKFAQKMRRRDRARISPRGVLYVGDVALDHLAVVVAHRQLAKAFSHLAGGDANFVHEQLVVAEYRNVDGPKSDGNRAGQRRQIDY